MSNFQMKEILFPAAISLLCLTATMVSSQTRPDRHGTRRPGAQSRPLSEERIIRLYESGTGLVRQGKARKGVDILLQARSNCLRSCSSTLQGELNKSLEDVASFLLSAGERLRREKTWGEAREFLEQAARLGSALGLSGLESVAQNNLGILHHQLGRNEEAFRCLHEAVRISRAIRDFDGATQTTGTLCSIAVAIGKPTLRYQGEQKSYCEELETLIENISGPVKKAGAYNNIGKFYVKTGKLNEAIRSHTEAQSIAVQNNSCEEEANALHNLGLVYQELASISMAKGEEYDQALAYYEKAAKLKCGDPEDYIVTLNNMGSIYHNREQFRVAEKKFTEAYDLSVKIGMPNRIAHSAYNIGKLKTDQAFKREGKEQKRLFSEGLEYLSQAASRLGKIGHIEGMVTVLIQIAAIKALTNQSAEAEADFNVILKTSDKERLWATKATGLNWLGWLAEKKDPKAAIDRYTEAIKLLENVRQEAGPSEFRSSLDRRIGPPYQRLVQLLLKEDSEKYKEKAFNLSECARARSFLDQLSRSGVDPLQGASATMRGKLGELNAKISELSLNVPKDQKENIENARALEEVKRDYRALLTQYESILSRAAVIKSALPLELPEIQAILKGRKEPITLLSWFTTPENTFVFIITGNNLEIVSLGVGEGDLTTKIDDLKTALAYKKARKQPLDDDQIKPFKDLYHILIEPIRTRLETKLVGIIPVGDLHYLPFSALTEDGKQWFGEDKILFYLPSASLLPVIQRKRSYENTGALIMAQEHGDPKRNLPSLPYAKDEAEEVARLFSARPLTFPNSTVTEFRRRAGSSRIIHFASHALIDPVNPMFSWISLSPDKESDGLLYVKDISLMSLPNIDLVCLSGCNTSVGSPEQGNGFVSLNRSFIIAGASSVVSSLWRIDDEATSFLMTRFYQNLKDGMSKAQALQEAQKTTREKFYHPAFWSAFVLTGDPGPSPDDSRKAAFAGGPKIRTHRSIHFRRNNSRSFFIMACPIEPVSRPRGGSCPAPKFKPPAIPPPLPCNSKVDIDPDCFAHPSCCE